MTGTEVKRPEVGPHAPGSWAGFRVCWGSGCQRPPVFYCPWFHLPRDMPRPQRAHLELFWLSPTPEDTAAGWCAEVGRWVPSGASGFSWAWASGCDFAASLRGQGSSLRPPPPPTLQSCGSFSGGRGVEAQRLLEAQGFLTQMPVHPRPLASGRKDLPLKCSPSLWL